MRLSLHKKPRFLPAPVHHTPGESARRSARRAHESLPPRAAQRRRPLFVVALVLLVAGVALAGSRLRTDAPPPASAAETPAEREVRASVDEGVRGALRRQHGR